MRLKYIHHVSFAKSEWTNYKELAKKFRWRLMAGEVACLVSMTGKQLLFVYAPNVDPNVLRSERFRLTNGSTWDPLMLVNYADGVGIKLDGLKRFEEHYEALQGKKGK